jgi:HK97 family phage major capsid protein
MTVLTREQLYERRDQARAELDRLRDQRDELLARAAQDGALDDTGVIEKANRLTTGIDRAEQQALEAGRAILTEAARDPENREEPHQASRRDTAEPFNQRRSAALRANERAGFLPEKSREHMERELREDDDPEERLARYVEMSSSRDYFRAFSAWMRDPVSGGHEWTDAERQAVARVKYEARALGITTGGSGGFLVPYELDPQILISSAGAVSDLRQVSRVVSTAYNEKRFITSTGVTSHWYAEFAEVTDDSPALLQPAIICKKAMAFVPVSFELSEDSTIAQQVGTLFADSKQVEEARVFTVGNGTTEPKGISRSRRPATSCCGSSAWPLAQDMCRRSGCCWVSCAST